MRTDAPGTKYCPSWQTGRNRLCSRSDQEARLVILPRLLESVSPFAAIARILPSDLEAELPYGSSISRLDFPLPQKRENGFVLDGPSAIGGRTRRNSI